MKVRFKLAWRHYRVGDIIEPPGTLRQWLMQRGFIEVLEPPVETAAIEPVAERRVQKGKRR